MRGKHSHLILIGFLAVLLRLPPACRAQNFTVLVNFDGTNGTAPNSIIQGSDGNFYGTTFIGGAVGPGTVFKMTPGGTLTTLYSFSGPDGGGPGGPISVGGLLQGQDGNLYGTTFGGGGPALAGTVFKITTGGTLTTLYAFQHQADGYEPTGALAQGPDGTLYGTTFQGGGGCGSVYSVTADGAFSSLFPFCSDNSDPEYVNGVDPLGGLVRGADGNLYGTTTAGGAFDNGEIFQITPSGALTVLYSFGTTLAQAFYPITVFQASDGNFYGATDWNGLTTTNGTCPGQACGTIFKLAPGGTLTTLHAFSGSDGVAADALVQGLDGNLYGTTGTGGSGTGGTGTVCKDGCGTVFQMSLGGAFATLYNFSSAGVSAPTGIIQGKDGALYGTATGQSGNNGVIFRLTPGAPSTNSGPSITAGVVSGASFQPGIVSDSWISISGSNLASQTDSWTNSIINGMLPTTLDGVSVSVGGRPAYISYISPSQINAISPDIPAGPAQVTVTSNGMTSAPVTATVEPAQPAFFLWGSYAVATRQDFSLAVKNGTFPGTTTTPARPGDVIILWGTGFGPTSPAAPMGEETPSDTIYNTASPVSVSVGGMPATVYGAALAPGYAGLYQLAIQIPALADGDYPVVATISGATSPMTTLITVQQ
jgi:uncharacterized protein (TIGR03437 family)